MDGFRPKAIMPQEKIRFHTFPLGPDDIGRRLDRVARKFLAEQSLGTILRAIRRGEIEINGKKRDGSYRVQSGDQISVRTELCPRGDGLPGVSQASEPPWLRDSIVLENDNILALNKPRGVLVHGPDSLRNAVLAYLSPTRTPSLSFTPGPLHRLDRNTSGLILFGKSTAGAARFTALMKRHSVRKEYLALLEGKLSGTETWNDRLIRDRAGNTTRASEEGRAVQCLAAPLLSSQSVTLIRLVMTSGFTHQLRAQAAIHRHPLFGDIKYGASARKGRYLLHARTISLAYYDTVLGLRSVEAPVPHEFRNELSSIFGAQEVSEILGRF